MEINIVKESRLVVVWGMGGKEWVAKGQKKVEWWKYLVVMSWVCITVKIQQIVYLMWMWFIVHKLYINEVPGKEIKDKFN